MNTATKRVENYKNFEKELELIEKLNSLDNCEINLIEHEEIETRLSKKEKKFNLEIKTITNKKENISFILDKTTYEVERFGNSSKQTKLNINKSANFSTTLGITDFKTKNFSNKSLFKAFYQVNLKEIKTFHTEFETITHQRNEAEYFYDCIHKFPKWTYQIHLPM